MDNGFKNKSLPLDKFSNWIYSICVVAFDIELGQTMECIYPKHIKLNDVEKSNVNYSSFPDSNSGCMGDTVFHFRMRSSCLLKVHGKYSDDYSDFIKPIPNNLFGYVNFRQVRDPEIKRGYFQKSVVILSHLPFTNLFCQLVKLISDSYFENGEIGLEVVSHNIDKWPEPMAGINLNLPIRGTVIQTLIPPSSKSILDLSQKPGANSSNSLVSSCSNSTTDVNGNLDSTKKDELDESAIEDEIEEDNSSNNRRIRVSSSFIENAQQNNESFMNQNELSYYLPSPINQDCFQALGSVVNQLQILWELILTNQPLLVIANTPVLCSIIVQSLVNSIAPLQFTQEYRPFFTIHDSEFKEFTVKNQTTPAVILGITNPFFVKALSHWPNILKVTDVAINLSKDKHSKSPSYLLKQDEIKPGLYSHFKHCLQPDKSFIRSINKGLRIERPSSVQSDIIRKFFMELTQSFMYPLERYVSSLMPLEKEIIPFKSPPPLGKFNLEEFLRSLENNGPQLTSGIKGDWLTLYRQFYASRNFAAWLSQKQNEISIRLAQIHTEILCRADLSMWIINKPELELVDLIIQINTKRKENIRKKIPISREQDDRLIYQINTIMTALPPDLQDMLRKSTSGTGAPNYI